ncbi:MAG TPA: hypothetical protein VIJ79_07445 [Acidobacteriaceae bacterium]
MKENMMNVGRKMILISVGCFACVAAKAQVDCSATTNLICQVPFVSGATQNSILGKAAAEQQASIFNGPIGAQLSQLPLSTSAPGFITLGGAPYKNLGSILIDRPDTVGLGKFVVASSIQQFNFNHLDGIPIGNIPFVYTTSTGALDFPTQIVSQIESVRLKVNQYVVLATYGIGKKTDLTVIVPFSHVSIAAQTLNQTTYFITPQNTLGFSQVFQPNYVPGTASGVGDVTVNVKQQVWSGGGSKRGSMAVGGAMRFETGDALNYLGSGAYGFNLYGLIAYKAEVSPHAKFGYQWNTKSVLLNPTGAGPNLNLPGGAQYGGGVDIAMGSHVTASTDILANEFVNSPYITPGCQTIPASSVTISTPVCGATSSNTPGALTQTLVTLNQSTVTYTTANFSGGLKWKPFPGHGSASRLIVYGNVLVQMNNVGLRSDPSPSGGISWSFFAPLK